MPPRICLAKSVGLSANYSGYIAVAEEARQEPEIQEAYKTIIAHKGWLVSNKIVKMYQSMMCAVGELETVEPYTKMAFSPYPFKQ